MKVCYVLGTTDGGTGRHVRMLVAGLPDASVIGPAATGKAFGFPLFLAVEFTDRPRPARDLAAVRRLRRLLPPFDVVHAHGLRAAALTALALRGRPQALVVTIHNAPVADGLTGAVYRALELIVARRADSVLCVSADLEQRMRAAGARRVSRAVVPAADPVLRVLRSSPLSLSDAPLVLAVGRLATQKAFDVLIDAAVRWQDLTPAPRLAIVGVGPLAADLAAQAERLGVTVSFLGRRTDVPALLAGADVFVLPSRWEGQALILQEALRGGVPIVATRTGGNQDLTGADGALLVPPGDPGALAAAVRSVLTDPALAAKLRAAALDRARSLPTEADAVGAALREYRALRPSRDP
jgi:glycosyltransferase involved in cell wall biosynthesis